MFLKRVKEVFLNLKRFNREFKFESEALIVLRNSKKSKIQVKDA